MDRRTATALGVAAAVWAIVGTGLVVATRQPHWLLGAAFPAAGVAAAMHFAGLRGLLAGLCLLLIAPGVIGESSLLVTMLGLICLGAIAITYPREESRRAIDLALPGLGFLALAVATVLEGLPRVAVAYLVAAGIAALIISRTDFAVAAVRGLACVLAPLVVSYAFTLIIGFRDSQMVMWHVSEARNIQLYPPLTFGTWGGPPFIPYSARLCPLVGEPGLAMYLVIPVLALILHSQMRTRARYLALSSVLLAAIFTQAIGSLIALAAGLVVLAVTHLAVTMRRPLQAAMIALAALVLALPVLHLLLIYKVSGAAGSLIDRGLLGDGSAARAGNINVVVAYLNDPPVAVAVTCALAAFCLVVIRHPSPTALFAYVTFAIVSVFAQPSQWQIGAWLLLTMTLTIARRLPIALGDTKMTVGARPAPLSA